MKRSIGIALALLAAACVLASCGKGKEGTAKNPITLHVAHWNSLGDATIAKFEAENPGIKIEFERFQDVNSFNQVMQTRLSANEIPDILGAQENVFPDYVKRGVYLDITKEDFVGNLVDNARNELLQFGGGKIYGIPTDAWGQGIFVNLDMFKSAGIKVPTCYQEIMDAAKAFKAKGQAPFVQGIKDAWCVNQMFAPQYKLQCENPAFFDGLKSGQAKWTDEAGLKAYTDWYELFCAKGMMAKGSLGLKYEQAYQLFAEGKVPMWPMGTWAAELFKDEAGKPKQLGFEMDFIPLYANAAGQEPVNMGTTIGAMYAISASTKRAEAAKTFMRWFTKTENAQFFAKETGHIYPVKGVDYASLIPYGDKLTKTIFDIKIVMPFDSTVSPAVKSALTTVNQNLLANVSPVAKQLAELQKAQDTSNSERK